MPETAVRALEQFWRCVQSGDVAGVGGLLTPNGSWDDPLFNGAIGAAATAAALARLTAWYVGRTGGATAPIQHLRTTADTTRVVVESVLDLKDGLIWNQAEQKAEKAASFQLPVALVGDFATRGPGAFGALRLYFGTWSVLNGDPKVRGGPIAPDERTETARVMDSVPVIRRYFDCLDSGRAEILELFEPDGYFREPANNFACGGDQLKAHFSHILKLGGVGIEFLTATRQGDRLAVELQTIKWGTKRMAQPQAGFAIYELGPHGKIQGSRVYDSVVPPEF